MTIHLLSFDVIYWLANDLYVDLLTVDLLCVFIFSQSGTWRHGEQPPLHPGWPPPRDLRCRQPAAAVGHSDREEHDGELWPGVQHSEESCADDHLPLLQPPNPLCPQWQQHRSLWPFQGHPSQHSQWPLQLCELLHFPSRLTVPVQRRDWPEHSGVGAEHRNGRLWWSFKGLEQGRSERQDRV